MDDQDRIADDRTDADVVDEDSEMWPAGLFANQSPGASSGTAAAGSLAAGPIGAAQAGRLVEAEEPAEERPPHAHVPAAPEDYGYGLAGRPETADEGVSAPQREAEADELNG